MIQLILVLIFSIGITFTNRVGISKPDVKPKVYPSKYSKFFHFGFKNLSADLYWLRVLQSIDYCENETAEKAVNQGQGVDDILAQTLRPSRCHKGWVFQMLDLVTDLAPKFRKSYRIGAELLSVGVDDREGARIIFDKGVKQFPDYWELSYSASYHYLFEFQNPSKAAELLMGAAEAGGPYWFRQMAATLLTRSGKFAMAEITLKSYIEKYQGMRGEKQARLRLKEIYINQGLSEREATAKLNTYLKSVGLGE